MLRLQVIGAGDVDGDRPSAPLAQNLGVERGIAFQG